MCNDYQAPDTAECGGRRIDWQRGNSPDKHIQFIPAEGGWLALFEETTDEGIRIHADSVIAWCLGAQDTDDGHHIVSYGQAVIGASPWLDKADLERSSHFFALVREEQLEPDFVAEIKQASRHTRAEILAQAKVNAAERQQGHASWRRQHRTDKPHRGPLGPTKIF